MIKSFTELGVQIVDARGNARDFNDMLIEAGENALLWSGGDRTAAQQRLLASGFTSAQADLATRSDARQEIQRQKAEAAASKEAAEQAERLAKNWNKVTESFTRFILALDKKFNIFKKLNDGLEWLSKWVTDDSNQILIFLGALAIAVAACASPFVILAAKIAAVTAAAAALFKGLQMLFESEAFKKFANSEYGQNMSETDNGAFGGESAGISSEAYGYKSKSEAPAEKISGDKNEKIQKTIDYFVGKGWTREQASGIVANLVHESSLSHTAVGDNGQAYGVAQWHPDRQRAFARWAGKNIRNSTYDEQLAFVHYELTEGAEKAAGRRLRRAKTAGESGYVTSKGYERPADKEGQAQARARTAERISLGHVQLANIARPAPGNTDASTTRNVTNNVTINAPTGNSQDIAQTWLKYAGGLASFNSGAA